MNPFQHQSSTFFLFMWCKHWTTALQNCDLVFNVTYVWSTAQKCMNYWINKQSDVMSSGLCDAAGRMPGTCRSVWFPTMPPRSARNPTVSSRPPAAAETPPRGSCNTDSLIDSVRMYVLVWETGLSTHGIGVVLLMV